MKCISCGASIEIHQKCEYCGTICEVINDSNEIRPIHKGDLNISGVNGEYKYRKLIIKGNVNVRGVNNNITSVGKGSKVMMVMGNLNVSGANNDVYGVYCEGTINDVGTNNDVDI